MSRKQKQKPLSPEEIELFSKDPGAYLALMEAVKIAKANNQKKLDLNTLNLMNALFSDKPHETQTINEMERDLVPPDMKARHAEVKATKTKVQAFLEGQKQIGETLLQDIEKEFTDLLVNKTKYSKTLIVNKIYKLLANIAEYKLRMNTYPRSPGDMVKALNILIGIIKQLNPTEITLLTHEFRHTEKDCVELLIQITSGLPANYIKQVNIDQINPILETKLIPPLEEKNPSPDTQPSTSLNESKNQAAKNNKKIKKKKAKTVTPINEDSKFKYELKIKPTEQELKPILKTSHHRQYTNTKFIQPQKKKKVKHVHWQNEDKPAIKEQNSAPTHVEQRPAEPKSAPEPEFSSAESNSAPARVEQKSFEPKSAQEPEFFIQITPLESPNSSAESNSAPTHVEQKSFEPKSTQKPEISKEIIPLESSTQVGKKESFSKGKFIWKSKPKAPAVTQQPESAASPTLITRTVETYKKTTRIFSPTGEVQKEIIEQKMVASEQVEVPSIPAARNTFQPRPNMWYWQPAKIVTEYAITASLVVSYLECMQAETIKLAKLILADQPQNGGTLNTYYDFVSAHNNYIKSLYAQLPYDAERNYHCPVNPKAIEEIISANLEMHKIIEKLFKDSDYQEYKDLISICVGLREENIRILKEILPPGYWVNIEDVFVALPVPEPICGPEPFSCGPSPAPSLLWDGAAPVAVESKNSCQFFKQPKPIVANQKTTAPETKQTDPAKPAKKISWRKELEELRRKNHPELRVKSNKSVVEHVMNTPVLSN